LKRLKVIILFLTSIFLLSCSGNKKEETTLFPVKIDGKAKYINNKGKTIINTKFYKVGYFSEGIAKVTNNDKKIGYIDEKGQIIIKPKYEEGTKFSEGICFVVEKFGPPIALNKKGNEVFRLANVFDVGIFINGLARFSIWNDPNKLDFLIYGYIDNKGKIVIPAKFRNAGVFNNGLCNVQNNKYKWGYIDRKGNIKIDFKFDYASYFFSNEAIVRKGNNYSALYGTIGVDGKYIISPKFKKIYFDGDKYIVYINNFWGWIDRVGNMTIDPIFEGVGGFNNYSLAPASLENGKWGYINEKGEFQIEPKFYSASSFDNEMAKVQLFNYLIAFVNEEGEYIVKPKRVETPKDYQVSISTRYYNTSNILKIIPKDFTSKNFYEINNNTTKKEIISKFNLDSYLEKAPLIFIKNIKINSYIYIDLFVAFNSIDLIKYDNGFGTDYDYTKNSLSNKVTSLGYKIRSLLSINHNGDVIEMLKNDIINYFKDSSNTKTSSLNEVDIIPDSTNGNIRLVNYDYNKYLYVIKDLPKQNK